MNDPWNPTEAEVRDWAYQPDAMEPEQDWHLVLPGTGFEELYLGLVADPACPTRGYFLEVLYLLVGDAVRTGYGVHREERVEVLLERGLASGDPDLALWAERSRELKAHPEAFSYDAWCRGGLARTPRE
jgi:hypothetical protein